MQVLFSRAPCQCTSCGQAARAVARRITTAAPKRRVRAGDIFTACYSTLLASAAIADAEVKRERRKEWDRVIEEARSGGKPTWGGDEGELHLDLELEQKTYSKLSAKGSSAYIEDFRIPVAVTWSPVHAYDTGNNGPTMETALQGRLGALDLRIKQSLSANAVECHVHWGGEALDHGNNAAVEEWADENPMPGTSFREPQSRLHLDKREASISRLVLRFLGEISMFSDENSTVVEEPSNETKLVLEAIEGLHTGFSKFPNYNWGSHDIVSNTRSKLHLSLYKICQRTAPVKSEVDSMIAKICYNLLISTAPPSIITYNILIGELSRLKQHNLVELVINSYFCDTRYAPTMETIQLMLNHYIARGDRRGFRLMLDRMRGTGPSSKPSPGEPIGNMRLGMRSIKTLHLEKIQNWAAHHAPIHRNGQLIRKAPRNESVFETIIRGCLEMKDIRRAIRYLKAALREGRKLRSDWFLAIVIACVRDFDIRASQCLVEGLLSSWRDEDGLPLIDFPRYVRYAIYQLLGLCGVSVVKGTPNPMCTHSLSLVLLQDLLLHLKIESIQEKLNESADWIFQLRSVLGLEPHLNLEIGNSEMVLQTIKSPLAGIKETRRNLLMSQYGVLRSQVKYVERRIVLSEARLIQWQKETLSWTYGALSSSSQKLYDAHAPENVTEKFKLLLLLVQKDQQTVKKEHLTDMYIESVAAAWSGSLHVFPYRHALSIGC